MGDDTEIWSYTKVINLENYDQSQLLECLRNVVDASWLYLRSQESVIKELPGFKKSRLPNIESRKLLADKPDAHHRNYNIARIVWASAGILGGTAAIAGLVSLTMATPLLVAASAIAIAGGVTATAGAAGSLVTEGIIERVESGKMNKLLKEDKAYLEKVFPFVQRTSELKAAVEELMNFSFFQNMIKSFGDNPDVVNAIREERPMQKLPQGMNDFINGLPIHVNQKQQMTQILLDIMRSREGIELFRHIFDFFWKESPIYQNHI